MRLAQTCSIQSGYSARTRLEPVAAGGVPAIQWRDLAADGGIDPDALIRVDVGDMSARHLVSAGDVLFRSRGDRNTATALDERFAEPSLAVLPLMVLRPKAGILPDYLAWAINQTAAQRHFDSTARGTSIRMVPRSALDDLDIDIPDLETQAHIVAVDRLAARERDLTRRLAEARKTLTSLRLAERARRPTDRALPERSQR